MLLRRKRTVILIALAAIILIASCFYYFVIYHSVRTVSIQADYKGYSTGEALFSGAELVVIGSPIKDFEDREMQVTTFSTTGAIEDFYTLTEIKVEKVLKGSVESPILKVIEPIALNQTLTGREKIAFEDYTEMKNGSQYLIFMRRNTKGQYSVINMQAGKFNLDQTDQSDFSKENKIKQKIFEEIKMSFGSLTKHHIAISAKIRGMGI